MSLIGDLIEERLRRCKLHILLFGPSVNGRALDEPTEKLRKKRIEIKAALKAVGHEVYFGEDLHDPGQSPPLDDPVFQEKLAMLSERFDLVINIVHTPGSHVELTEMASRNEIARKSHIILDRKYENDPGLITNRCKAAQVRGARLEILDYATDVDSCAMRAHVMSYVEKVHRLKATLL